MSDLELDLSISLTGKSYNVGRLNWTAYICLSFVFNTIYAIIAFVLKHNGSK